MEAAVPRGGLGSTPKPAAIPRHCCWGKAGMARGCLGWHGGVWEELKSASAVGEADAQVSATPLLIISHLQVAPALGLGVETL